MSVIVSWSNATFRRNASNRLVCASWLVGCDWSATRLSTDGLVDDGEVLLESGGHLRIERVLVGLGDLLEARNGVLVVLFGQLQFHLN